MVENVTNHQSALMKTEIVPGNYSGKYAHRIISVTAASIVTFVGPGSSVAVFMYTQLCCLFPP